MRTDYEPEVWEKLLVKIKAYGNGEHITLDHTEATIVCEWVDTMIKLTQRPVEASLIRLYLQARQVLGLDEDIGELV